MGYQFSGITGAVMFFTDNFFKKIKHFLNKYYLFSRGKFSKCTFMGDKK